MKESNFNYRGEPTMAEKEALTFEYFKSRTLILSQKDYEAIYQTVRDHIGVNSPGMVLYENFSRQLGLDKVLGEETIKGFLIAIDHNSVPDKDYLKYLLEHESWELYIRDKEGFNLKRVEDADQTLPFLEKTRPAHRYSCYKEFQMAYQDGRADAYLEWWDDFYNRDLTRVENLSEAELARIAPAYGHPADLKGTIKEFIEKNRAIKHWAYDKVLSTKGAELDEAD